MLARFFIDRPVLAWVISLVIVLLGAIAAALLPIAEYPEISPPTIQVTARFPGANAKVITDTVAAPIEQQVVGVENMLYMTSQSNNDGSYTLDVTFKLGTDVDLAQVQVQNRVAIAEPQLPTEVRATGVVVRKSSPDILLVVALYSEDNPDTGRPYYDLLYMNKLFGLVLAIGIVVDDAIVVLENIERWLDKGLGVREATIQAMNEITGPILAITLVLSSVLLPSAFLGGLTGQFFRQFALTISVAMIISAINAMTMTPARAAWIFASRKPGEHGNQGKEALPWWSFALGGTPVTIHRYVEGCDAAIKLAQKAGATVKMPAQDMFWGDRYRVVIDPFGHTWSFGTHISDLTPEEMAEGAKAAFAQV